MVRLFDRLFGSTVDAPWLMLSVIALLTGLSLYGRWYPEQARNWRNWLPQTQQLAAPPAETAPAEKPPAADAPATDSSATPAPATPAPATSTAPPRERAASRNIPDVSAVSVSDADVILVVESQQFFTPAGSRGLREVVAAIEQLDYVRDVFWIDRVPVLNLFGIRESLFPGDRASQRQFDVAREKAIAHPLVGGQLLSKDGQSALLLIKLDWLFVTSDEDCTERIKQVARSVSSQIPDNDFRYMVTGKVPIYLTFVNSQLVNRWMYQLIGYGMIALMAMLLFRGLRAVMIVAVAPSLGVFWTIGLLNFFDLQDNPFNDIVLPILLSLIGLADGIHLLVEIRRQRAHGAAPQAAARAGVCKVGLACALTSITTAIGFGSLAMAHHEIVREFGWSCVLGVFLTFISVITTIPLACASRLGRNLHIGHEKGLIDRNLTHFRSGIEAVIKHARPISYVAIVSTLILTAISLTLRPDERRGNALPASSETARAIAHMDRAFGGLEQSSIQIRWTDQIPDDDPQILEVLIELDDVLTAQPLIGSPLSLRNFIDILPGDGDPIDRMPLNDLLPPPLKRAFYEPEKNQAVLNFRVQDLGIAQYGPIFEEIEQRLRDIEVRHPAFTLTPKGSAFSRWKDLYQIVIDLAASLGSASLIIFLVLSLVYRSLRLGLISLIPNFFPLAVTGTYLALSGQALELASVCAFTVCLGIAVDDTIHFLTRFEEERDGRPIEEAIIQSFTSTGTALIMTSVILVIGFATVLFSDLRDQRIFATMGVLTISSALFADLFFLPALLKTFCDRQTSSEDGRNNPATHDFEQFAAPSMVDSAK